MPEPWQILDSTSTYRDRWLSVRSDRCRTADGRVVEPYHVLEYPDWINVVALTPEARVVLVREYRHGAGRVLTSLPAGTVEPTDPRPEVAARRELREETGYEGGRFFPLASSYANPANQVNRVHPFLAVGVRPTGTPSLDPNEEIEVVPEDFLALVDRLWRGEVAFQVSHLAALHQAVHAILGGVAPDLEDLRRDLRGLLSRRYGLVASDPESPTEKP
jgi:ADP-ribose pyrophosphatase